MTDLTADGRKEKSQLRALSLRQSCVHGARSAWVRVFHRLQRQFSSIMSMWTLSQTLIGQYVKHDFSAWCGCWPGKWLFAVGMD